MKNMWMWLIITSFLGALAGILFAGLLFWICSRTLIQSVIGRFTKRLMSDRYSSNIWEMVTALTRTGPIAVVENSLRAVSGAVIERPFGSPRKFLNFDGLIFSPAQLAVLPAHENAEVDMSVIIGPKAKKTLKLDIPLMAAASTLINALALVRQGRRSHLSWPYGRLLLLEQHYISINKLRW